MTYDRAFRLAICAIKSSKDGGHLTRAQADAITRAAVAMYAHQRIALSPEEVAAMEAEPARDGGSVWGKLVTR